MRVTTAGSRNWIEKSTSMIAVSPRLSRSVTSAATAYSATATDRKSSTRSRPASGSGPVPRPTAYAIGSVPSASVYWLTAPARRTAAL